MILVSAVNRRSQNVKLLRRISPFVQSSLSDQTFDSNVRNTRCIMFAILQQQIFGSHIECVVVIIVV